MDDRLAISVAKTEYREGFNNGNVDRVLSVFCDAFTDMSEGQPSFFGSDSPKALRERLQDLFQQYEVRLFVIIINVIVEGDTVIDYGWHKLWLTPRNGGGSIYNKLRYFERWTKDSNGVWKIDLMMTNKEEPPQMEPFAESEIVKHLAWAG